MAQGGHPPAFGSASGHRTPIRKWMRFRDSGFSEKHTAVLTLDRPTSRSTTPPTPVVARTDVGTAGKYKRRHRCGRGRARLEGDLQEADRISEAVRISPLNYISTGNSPPAVIRRANPCHRLRVEVRPPQPAQWPQHPSGCLYV